MYPYCYLLLSWKSWNWFGCVVGGMLICLCLHVVGDVSMVSMANWNKGFCSPAPCSMMRFPLWWNVWIHQQPHEKINGLTHHLQHTQISSNFSTIPADNSMGTYIIHYSIEITAFSAEYTLFNNCNFNLVYWYSLSINLTLSVTVKCLPDAVDAIALCSWG